MALAGALLAAAVTAESLNVARPRQAAMSHEALGFPSASEIHERMEELMALLDGDGDDRAKIADIQSHLGAGAEHLEADIWRLAREHDADGDGELDKSELLDLLLRQQAAVDWAHEEATMDAEDEEEDIYEDDLDEQAAHLFHNTLRQQDLNNDGELSLEELRTAGGLEGLSGEDERRETLKFHAMDVDGNGALSQHEFEASEVSAPATAGAQSAPAQAGASLLQKEVRGPMSLLTALWGSRREPPRALQAGGAKALKAAQSALDLMRKADANHDGALTIDEVIAMAPEDADMTEDSVSGSLLRRLFKTVDINKNGSINAQEIGLAARGVFTSPEAQALLRMLTRASENRGGR